MKKVIDEGRFNMLFFFVVNVIFFDGEEWMVMVSVGDKEVWLLID